MVLADEFIKATPDLTPVQLDGLKKMIAGISSMITGGFKLLKMNTHSIQRHQYAASVEHLISFIHLWMIGLIRIQKLNLITE